MVMTLHMTQKKTLRLDELLKTRCSLCARREQRRSMPEWLTILAVDALSERKSTSARFTR